jgi:hypothetical protein
MTLSASCCFVSFFATAMVAAERPASAIVVKLNIRMTVPPLTQLLE